MIIENSMPLEIPTDVLVKAFLKILLNDGLISNKTYLVAIRMLEEENKNT